MVGTMCAPYLMRLPRHSEARTYLPEVGGRQKTLRLLRLRSARTPTSLLTLGLGRRRDGLSPQLHGEPP
jgi:hypothetical protein